jgi:hypothetical protein
MCNPVDRDRFADSSPPPGVPVWVDRRWACAHPSRRIGAAFSCHAFGCCGRSLCWRPTGSPGQPGSAGRRCWLSIGRRCCDQSAQLGELAFAVVSGGQGRLVWSCPPQGQGGQDGQCEEGDPSGHDRQSRGHGTPCTSAHIAYLDVPHYLDNTAPTPVGGRQCSDGSAVGFDHHRCAVSCPLHRLGALLRRGLGLVSLAGRDDLPVAGLEPESVLLGPVLVDREQSRHQTIPIARVSQFCGSRRRSRGSRSRCHSGGTRRAGSRRHALLTCRDTRE